MNLANLKHLFESMRELPIEENSNNQNDSSMKNIEKGIVDAWHQAKKV
jgi:hypothetical protein